MSPRLRNVLIIIGVAVVAFGLVATRGGSRAGKLAAKSVEKFHGELNDSKFGEIYDSSTPDFKATSSEADFIKFAGAIHRKLGAFQSGEQTGWNYNMDTMGTFIRLTYKSHYEKGDTNESFTFVIGIGTATLQGYRIDSQTLITE